MSSSFSWQQRIDSLAFVVFLGVVAWAPIPLASNRAWSVSLLALVVCTLLSVVLFARAFDKGTAIPSRSSSERHAWLPLLAFVALTVLIVCQLLPLPVSIRSLFVPGTTQSGAVSIDVFATRRYLLTSLTYLSAFTLVLLLVRTEQRIRNLLLCIVAAGILQSVIAIVVLSTAGTVTFLFSTLNPNLRASGTFANPDHLAGYLELCLASGFGLLLWSMGAAAAEARGWQARMVWLLKLFLSSTMLLRLLLIVMVIALVLTRSRMGNAAFLLSLLVTGVVCAVMSTRLRRMAVTLIVSILLVDIIVVGQWVGIDKVVERLEATSTQRRAVEETGSPAATRSRQEESLEERFQAARYAIDMPLMRPWLGFGGGTFYSAFMPFKGPHPLSFFDHAHNDYVEIAADTGFVGLGLLGAMVLASAWRAARSISDRTTPLARGAALGIFMAICSIGLHSVVDFNLQIPANALTVTVLLAMAWRLPSVRRSRSRRRPVGEGLRMPRKSPGATEGRANSDDPAAYRPVRTMAALVVAAVATAWVASFGTQQMRSDFATMGARDRIARCLGEYKTWSPGDWADAESNMSEGIRIDPTNPVFRDVMAQLHACHAVAVWRTPEQARALFRRVRDESVASLALRADYAPALVSLSSALRMTQAPAVEVNASWEAALRYAPHEPRLDDAMMDVVLRGWNEATPAMKQWARDRYTNGPAKQRLAWAGLAKTLGRDGVLSIR